METDDLAVVSSSRSIDQTASGASGHSQLKRDRHDLKLAQNMSKTKEASSFQLIQKRDSATKPLMFLNNRVQLMLSALFPLVYGSVFVFLLVQAFRMMRLSSAPAKSIRRTDRTGLLTTHPELLDANGSITGEDLLVVRFPSQDQSEASITD